VRAEAKLVLIMPSRNYNLWNKTYKYDTGRSHNRMERFFTLAIERNDRTGFDNLSSIDGLVQR
jgi:hypothetical protein